MPSDKGWIARIQSQKRIAWTVFERLERGILARLAKAKRLKTGFQMKEAMYDCRTCAWDRY